MPWSRINYAPGINKDATRYSADGTWVDSSLVRFRNGAPERWSGWVRYLPAFLLDGACRSVHRWAVLSGASYFGLGTNKRFYAISDDITHDVSPIQEVRNLTNPFQSAIGTPTVTIVDTGHSQLVGQILEITSTTAVGGLTISGEYVVTGYIDNNHYQITASSNATSNATGGGTVVISIIYQAGTVDQVSGGGWGADAWGENFWGGSGQTGDQMGLWSQDNWGEDLVACIYDGPIFYWFASTPDTRMVNIRSLPGADGFAPTLARFIVVSHKDRILLAFGVGEEFGGSTYAPMTVRWCTQENIFNWNEADETGTAGSLPLSRGSRFLAVQPTQAEILAWSDASLYSLQFVGAPDVYTATIISESSDIAGANACCAFGTSVFWMGRSGFYVYDGRVTKVPSTVWDFVNRNINWDQANKIVGSTNRANDEVIWFYPSINGLENDSYVSYNVAGQFWMVGQLSRTAWLDIDFQSTPFAVTAGGQMFYHDVGMDDGSVNPPIPLNAYLEGSPFELSYRQQLTGVPLAANAFNEGDRFSFIRRIMPDVTFLDNDGVNAPNMQMTIKTMDTPGGGFISTSSSQVIQTAILPVEEFTTQCQVRLRGRSISLRFESNTLGSQWRIGWPRFDIRTDGQR